MAHISLISDTQFASLVSQYMGLVRIISRKYYMPGGDFEDVVQEGLIGLYKAARDYNSNENSSFRNFASMVIERHLISAIKTARRGKAMILTQADRLESLVQKNLYTHEKELEELIADDVIDPLDKMIAEEQAALLWDRARKRLSPMELKVLKYHFSGYSNQEIASALTCTVKSVDNALTRSRNKFKAENKKPDESVG